MSTSSNVEIWRDIYSAGRMLWYPYDAAVRIIHRLNNKFGLRGVILDHGCGSGNHLEFMVRLGLDVTGTEIASTAIPLVKARFAGAKLPSPMITLVDPDQPLGPQLPRYSHAFIWGSVYYNRKAKVLQDLRALIDGLPAEGCFVLAVPSANDVVADGAIAESDGSLRMAQDISTQKGAIVTVAQNEAELIEWCSGIDVEDCGKFGWVIGGIRSEFLFLCGRKSAR